MTHPIDIIANAIREVADLPPDELGSVRFAHAVAESLTDPAIVDNAVQALKDDGWATRTDRMGIRSLSNEELIQVARIVLRSVGGA